MTQYRQEPPKTLMDALSQPQGNYAPAPASAPQAANVVDDRLRQRLIDMIFAEEPPQPVPEQINPWQKAIGQGLAGLGDAVTAFSAGITNNPGFQTNYADRYLERQRQDDRTRMQIEADNIRRKGLAKREKASFLMSEMDRKQARADEQAGRLELKNLEIAAREADRKQRADDRAASLAQDQAQFEAQKKAAIEMENLKFSHEKITAGIRTRAANGDEEAKADKKALGEIYGTVSALAMTAKKNLAEGKTTPEEMIALADAEIDSAMLSPDGEKAARLYVQRKFGPVFQELQDAQTSAELSKMGPTLDQAQPTFGIEQDLMKKASVPIKTGLKNIIGPVTRY